jgi:predicted amidophosphoribosyltransferase
MARGVSEVTGLPLFDKAVRRIGFKRSQTSLGRWERHENVEKVFELIDGAGIQGKHLLVVDDVVTTGVTIIACSKELVKAGDVKISVLSLGFAKS